jgi:hypothetical protein
MKNNNRLTKKQEELCKNYLQCGDKQEAYMNTYSCDRMKPDTIAEKTSDAFANPLVADRIEQLQADVVSEFELTNAMIVKELMAVAFCENPDEYKKSEKLKALEMLARIRQMYSDKNPPDKKGGLENLDDETLRRIIAGGV